MQGKGYQLLLLAVASLLSLELVAGDTPANCTYEDVVGKWTFQIGEGGFDRTLNCSGFTPGKPDVFFFCFLLMDDGETSKTSGIHINLIHDRSVMRLGRNRLSCDSCIFCFLLSS